MSPESDRPACFPSVDELMELARRSLDEANRVREEALGLSRELVRTAANSIRSTHRGEDAAAHSLLERGSSLSSQLLRIRDERPDIFFTGYVQDSLKELAEALCVFALVHSRPIPHPPELEIPWPAYLNGLGEAIGELRRHCLDLLRRQDLQSAETGLDQMDAIFSLLVSLDYPDAVTSGLRRTTDNMRGILERTRADLTTAVLQQRLAERIEKLSAALPEGTK